MLACVDRRERLDTAITEEGNSAFTPVVTRLGCLRGISTLTAFGLAVEIGDWQRLNGRSMRLPVALEAAWHHRHRATAAAALTGQAATVRWAVSARNAQSTRPPRLPRCWCGHPVTHAPDGGGAARLGPVRPMTIMLQ